MKHNRKHSLRSKGQDIIEYALMLAIVVGIGFLIYNQSNMADKINAVFGNANNLLATVEKESDPAVLHDRNYADAMAKMLKDAIAKGSVQLSDGATVGIYAQNAPNGKADKYNINGLKTGNVTVNGKITWPTGPFTACGKRWTAANPTPVPPWPRKTKTGMAWKSRTMAAVIIRLNTEMAAATAMPAKMGSGLPTATTTRRKPGIPEERT